MKYVVKIYETHCSEVNIEAEDEKEAVFLVVDGQGEERKSATHSFQYEVREIRVGEGEAIPFPILGKG